MPDRRPLHHQVDQIAAAIRCDAITNLGSDHCQTGSSLGRATLIPARANTG